MICKKCGIELTLENARKRNNVKSGFRPICKKCRNEYERSRTKQKRCEFCNKLCIAKGLRTFCSIFCRFSSYYKINPITKCWEWISKKDKDGYGKFIIGKKSIRAHRFSYEFFESEIMEKMFICHSCDNPSCVNPKHLWLGTNQDNQIDSVKKGRRKSFKKYN